MNIRFWIIILVITVAALSGIVCGGAESITTDGLNQQEAAPVAGRSIIQTVEASPDPAVSQSVNADMPSFIQKGKQYEFRSNMSLTGSVVTIQDDGWINVEGSTGATIWFNINSGVWVRPQ